MKCRQFGRVWKEVSGLILVIDINFIHFCNTNRKFVSFGGQSKKQPQPPPGIGPRVYAC